MDLFLNELSIHQQFPDIRTFHESLGRLVAMRNCIRRLGREIYCHHAILVSFPLPGMQMQQAIARLTSRDQQRIVITWLTQAGRLWDQERQHGADDWLECRDEIVTESAVGEAAYRQFHDVDCGLLSAAPSRWNYSPVEVLWRRAENGAESSCISLPNWWEVVSLEHAFEALPNPVESWIALHGICLNRFENLAFADDCFDPLEGIPFAKSSAFRIIALLSKLDRFAICFDDDGQRTSEGQQIYNQYFTGETAMFSDSSDSEKERFSNQLTFSHPHQPHEALFCPWHGKERHLTLRLHFSWPVRAGESVFVVYVGPKITKR